MASNIENLYLKYCNRVQRNLENDAYYQYILELIAGGKTTVSQINRVMDKIVDEKWLTAIEVALPAIHEIIARPRRFLKTVETVAPVEKVKKVSADSVRHLASHTQFITGMRGGMVYPGQLLTVETEESADLYENRFVNTLIRKLSEFIEKRTSALFWETENEEMSILRIDSSVEDDYESIEYKLDMTVKNKQTYMENDSSKMEVFKRIDRVRRVVTDFRSSTFAALMADTAPVHSPIQRTNQIVKNPDYRKCYDLWQFLERYDQVGYEVDVKETALDFDEDYLFQMYGNVAVTYVVFKSLLETDTRRITETPKRRKVVKPKFVKQIVEEFVDDYDIPDVEVRRVVIEEVTKAQLEIERRTREQEKLKAAKEKEAEKVKAAREKEKEKLRLEKEKEAEKARAIKEKEAEKLRLAKEKEKELEKAKAAKEKEQERAKLAREKEAERAKLMKAKEAEKARQLREKELEKAKLAREKEAEKARQLREKELEKAKLAREKEAAKAKLLKEKEKEKEHARILKEKEAEKAKRLREKELAQAKLAREKEAEKAKRLKEKEKEKAKLAKAQQGEQVPAGAKPKVPAKPKPTVAPQPTAEPALVTAEEPAAVTPTAEPVPEVVEGVAETVAEPVPEVVEAVAETVAEPVPEVVEAVAETAAEPVPEVVEAVAETVAAVLEEESQAKEHTPPVKDENPILSWMRRRRKKQ